MMKKMVMRVAVLVLALLMVACSSGKEKKMSELYMIQSSFGEVVGNRESGYKLVLEEPHSEALWFADRPVRKAGYVEVKDILKIWNEGNDSFAEDPPNAVMVMGNNHPIVIELILESWNAQKAVFKIQALEGQRSLMTTSGPVVLYIDSMFGGSGWRQAGMEK